MGFVHLTNTHRATRCVAKFAILGPREQSRKSRIANATAARCEVNEVFNSGKDHPKNIRFFHNTLKHHHIFGGGSLVAGFGQLCLAKWDG